MSYILDALKKSDSERQQRQGPSLASVQQQQYFYRRSRRGWGTAMLVGFVLTFAAAAVWLYQLGYLQIALPAPAITDAASPPIAPLQAEQTKSTSSKLVPEVAPSAVDPSARPIASRENARLDVAPAALDPMPPPGNMRELWQLPAALRAGIPPLEFSLHVYSTRLEQRSIIINNRMMREGEYVNPELLLSVITPDGVVMKYRNEYFRVSIVDNW